MNSNKTTSVLHWISVVMGGKKIYIVILLLVQMSIGISSVFYAVIMRDLIDEAVAGNRRGFFVMVVALVGLVILQITLGAFNRFLEEYSKATMENCFKSRLFRGLLEKDYELVTSVHSGEWMNRLTSDTFVVAEGLAQIIPGVAGMITKMFGALVMILFLEPRFMYILIPGGLLLVILTYAFRKQLKKLHKKVQEADGKVRVFLQESLSSMLVVRAFVKEDQVFSDALNKMEAHKNARMRKNYFANLCNIGFGGAMKGAYVLGAGVCGYGILKGTMSYGTLMAILQLIGQIQSPFANITGYLPRYYAMLASAERLREVERIKVKDGLSSIETNSYADSQQIITNNFKNQSVRSLEEIQDFYHSSFVRICFNHADFTYKSISNAEEKPCSVVLRDVNISIKKGEYVAFTGPSGCGKSTILKILMCLYSLDAGECLMEVRSIGDKNEGIDTSSNKQTLIPLDSSYRRLFTYVPQGNHLMSGTIREIIAFSDENAMKQEDRIWNVLDISCGKEFVTKLPLGIDTVLGECGLGLSEGQMQRIAIARAVFADNPILILDESTSALDDATEKQLLKNLRAMTDKTVLIVTHRSAVLNICNKEIRFSGDRIVIRDCDEFHKSLPKDTYNVLYY